MWNGVTPIHAARSNVSISRGGGMRGRSAAGWTGQCMNRRPCHCIASAQGPGGTGQGRCAAPALITSSLVLATSVCLQQRPGTTTVVYRDAHTAHLCDRNEENMTSAMV